MITSKNKPIAYNILLSIVILITVIVVQVVFHRYATETISNITDDLTNLSEQKFRITRIAQNYNFYNRNTEHKKYLEHVLLREASTYNDFIHYLKVIPVEQHEYYSTNNEIIPSLIKQWEKMYLLVKKYNTDLAQQSYIQYSQIAVQSVVYLEIINNHLKYILSQRKANNAMISNILLVIVFSILVWIIFHSIRNVFRPLSILTEISQKMANGDYDGQNDIILSNEFLNISTALNTARRKYLDETTDLKTQANYDELTGLLNRRGFEAIFKHKIQSDRSCQSCSLLLIDIDKFKLINDTYGHQIGDQVLKSVGTALKDFVRDTDVVARYGGEEFIFALSGSASCADLAWDMAERTRILLSTLKISIGTDIIRITASIGLFTSRDMTTNLDQAIEYADAALYEAKNTGRNKVVTYNKMS